MWPHDYSEVYRARNLELPKMERAIKVLRRDADDAVKGQFNREAEILLDIRSPHVVEVAEFRTDEDGRPYLIMELLHGRTLEDDGTS